jgi:hypothetical protein
MMLEEEEEEEGHQTMMLASTCAAASLHCHLQLPLQQQLLVVSVPTYLTLLPPAGRPVLSTVLYCVACKTLQVLLP